MKRKLPSPSSSSSSSSSSSCIESPPLPIPNVTEIPLKPQPQPKSKPKPKRVRTKKLPTHNSATSTKSRSSIYRGVTRHRWTGRFEAHLWDKSVWNNIQNKRGRQIYLGAYDNEEDAARTYDLAALKYWGPTTVLNFPVEGYTKDMEEMQKMSKEEYLASLRRRSSGFSRGVSKYRGVARHHHNGRWEARIGRVTGNKYLYLGTYATQEEAAIAYDMAAIEYRGIHAITNFDISSYADKLKKVQPDEEEEDDINVQAGEAQDHQGEEEEEVEAHNHQEDANKVSQPSVPKLELADSAIMDPIEEHDHPWNDLCINLNFNILPIPHMPLEKSAEVFDYKGFEDDIECIFDDNEILQDAIHVNRDGCKGTKAVTYPSSSLSTVSVCGKV